MSNSQKNKKILFVRQGERSFFKTDLEIFCSFADVYDFDNYPPAFAKLPLLLKKIIWCDMLYVWFMGRHAIVPLLLGKVFQKKIVLVAGGWDVANCPEIDYGLMRPGWASFIAKRFFKFPDLILSVSNSNHKELLKNTGVSEAGTKMIYHGFREISASPGIKKEKMVITIGEVNQSNRERKGLEMFVQVAKQMPDMKFIMIGRWAADGAIDYLKSVAPRNVEFLGYLNDESMKCYLDRAEVYAQLSYHEAFGCSVTEAMQHGCVPVVANQYALPEVVGNAGVVVNRNPEDIVKGIRHVSENFTAFSPRERIEKNFTYQKRRMEIQKIVENLQ